MAFKRSRNAFLARLGVAPIALDQGPLGDSPEDIA